MYPKAIAAAVAIFASIASGQSTSKTFDFTNKPGQQGLQEIATILRTVGNIQQLSIDPAASSLTVQGTSNELAMTAWILQQLDQPLPGVKSAAQYLVPGQSDDIIQVFHLVNTPPGPPQPMQELLTTLRTVADVQKVFNYTALADLVVRGPAAQIALAQYLIDSIDVVPGSVKTGAEFQDQSPGPASQVARVFYLSNVKTPQGVQEILTVLRTVVDVQKIFNNTRINALAIRSSAGNIATADFIIQSLDITTASKPGPSIVHQLIMPVNAPGGNIVRVFYPSHITTPQGIQETLTLLRTRLQIQKVFNYTQLPALVVRGSADQISKAEQLILEQDQSAKSTP